MVRVVFLIRTALHAMRARKAAWTASLMAFAVAAALVGTATANALLRPVMFKPSDLSSTKVQGKVDVQGDCGGYVSCRFHSSLERSSWRGWQTVDGSMLSQKFGLQHPTGWKLKGTYNYKTHFHAHFSQWGMCPGGGGHYPCLRSGVITKDSGKISLRRS